MNYDNLKLTIELIPKTSWYDNVRSHVSKEQWDTIRRKSYKNANYKCEICGGVGDKHPVECHEIWQYDDENNIQKLIGFISLCPNCHKVKHPGLAQIKNEFDIVINQLMKVNNMSKQEAYDYIDHVFKIWLKRSQHNWTVDIEYINEYLKS